jgi:Fe2+ or Zn2+ uptake regulation protein
MPDLIIEAAATARASGGRMTAQRRLILEMLAALGGHPTADEVYRAAHQQDASIHPSTVYRTLTWLESAGLVMHRHLDSGPSGERCERYDPATPIEHHHFICSTCGSVVEFEAPALETVKLEFASKHGAVVEHAALTLYGTCAACGNAKLDA